MDTKTLKEKSTEELKTEILALRREQFNLRMQKGSGQDIKSHLLRKVRRDIARIKTVMTERADRDE